MEIQIYQSRLFLDSTKKSPVTFCISNTVFCFSQKQNNNPTAAPSNLESSLTDLYVQLFV